MALKEKEMRKREMGRARREKQPKTGRGIDRRAKWMDTKKDEEGEKTEGWRATPWTNEGGMEGEML